MKFTVATIKPLYLLITNKFKKAGPFNAVELLEFLFEKLHQELKVEQPMKNQKVKKDNKKEMHDVFQKE